MRYDLTVIGIDRPGIEIAACAVGQNRRVAVVADPTDPFRSGWLMSAVIAEIVPGLYVNTMRTTAGAIEDRKPRLTMHDVRNEIVGGIDERWLDLKFSLDRQGIELLVGSASFVSENTVEVIGDDLACALQSDAIVIATGTTSRKPKSIPFDGRRIITTDELLDVDEIPNSAVVIGQTRTGLEQALLLAAVGVHVTVVETGDDRQSIDDDEIDLLLDRALSIGVELRTHDAVLGVDVTNLSASADQIRCCVHLESGTRILADTVVYAAERIGNTRSLNLRQIGIEPDERDCLWCNGRFETWLSGIYGTGDVVGFPRRSNAGYGSAQVILRQLLSTTHISEAAALSATGSSGRSVLAH